jgi:sulfur dioxygenase
MAFQVEELNGTNCKTYLLCAGSSAVLIDPVRERVEDYRKALGDRGVRLRMILETHMHADHLMLNREIMRTLDAPVIMHQKSPSPLVDRHVVDGDVLEVGGDSIRVFHTPGHTPDSVCYVIDGAVFTGDTLLIGGSGRTDFPGGDAGSQYDAVTMKLFTLPGGTIVYPGHDYKGRSTTTIGQEKQSNPRLAGKSREEYIAIMAGLELPMPERVQEALQVNQSGFESEEVVFPAVSDVAAAELVSATELAVMMAYADSPIVVDVREPEEFVGELGHIEGALLVPLDSLERRLPKLLGYADRPVVCVCRAGARSGTAAAILGRAGFRQVYNLSDGMLGWVGAGLKVQR